VRWFEPSQERFPWRRRASVCGGLRLASWIIDTDGHGTSSSPAVGGAPHEQVSVRGPTVRRCWRCQGWLTDDRVITMFFPIFFSDARDAVRASTTLPPARPDRRGKVRPESWEAARKDGGACTEGKARTVGTRWPPFAAHAPERGAMGPVQSQMAVKMIELMYTFSRAIRRRPPGVCAKRCCDTSAPTQASAIRQIAARRSAARMATPLE